jgi:hypothetical protein
MRHLLLPLITLAAALVSSGSFAQSAEDRKAAAQGWLARDVIKINYVGPN